VAALLAFVALFASTHVDRFDGARAFRALTHQVEMGPRPSGSPQSRELAAWLRDRLPHGRYDDHGPIRNVVGHLPGRRPAIVVAAHYDTKDMPGFVGAEDGAGGTAAVLEIARALRHMKRPAHAREVRFVLFDGEECTDDSREFYSCGLRGSRRYARAHAKEIKALILLDFVAQKELSLPREVTSDARLWSKLRRAAQDVGSGAHFPNRISGGVIDDHTPFLRRGVPAIDLIDFDFACWHKTCDDLTAVSESSLDASGEAVLELVRRLR
jgi:peptidase M28-like protein